MTFNFDIAGITPQDIEWNGAWNFDFNSITPTSSSSSNVKLPDGVIELEYLENDGFAYIDLPYGFYNTDEIDIKFGINATALGDKYIICPSKWNTNSNKFAMGKHAIAESGISKAPTFNIGYGNVQTGSTALKPYNDNNFDTDIHRWTYKNYIFSIKELGLSLDVSSLLFGTETANLRLFYGYNTPTAGRIEYYKHKKNGQLVGDFIPVIWTNGEYGMYDTVTEQFYGNANTTGSFTGKVKKLPDGYTAVDYIQSDGSAYINTGYKPNNKTRIYSNWYFDTVSSTELKLLFGTRAINSGAFDYAFSISNGDFRFDYNKIATWLNYKYATKTPYTIDINENKVYINDLSTPVKTLSVADFQCEYGLGLFCGLTQESSMGFGTTEGIRNNRLAIYEEDNLIHNFTPCISSQGEYGMYDLANSGKNLFNFYDLKKYAITGTDGVVANYNAVFLPSGTYSISAQEGSQDSYLYARLVKDYQAISSAKYIVVNSNIYTTKDFVVPKDCQLMIYDAIKNTNLATSKKHFEKVKIQVEYGAEITDYVPHPFYGNYNTIGNLTGSGENYNSIATLELNDEDYTDEEYTEEDIENIESEVE